MFSEYPSNRKICVVTTITHYLEITKDLRATDQLIISYKKPHKAVSTSTITRWCKIILWKPRIDIEKYSSHSTGLTSSGTAKIKGLPLTEINKAASWKKTSTFKRFMISQYSKYLRTYLFSDMLWLTNLVEIFNIYYAYNWKILSVFSNHINIC